MSNNIFYGNTGIDLILFSSGVVLVNNDIDAQKGTEGAGSVGNVKADPLFVGNGNYRLKSGSTLIDKGDNATAGTLTGTDLDGCNRIFNNTVDIGAYEHTVMAASHLWTDVPLYRGRNSPEKDRPGPGRTHRCGSHCNRGK